MKKLMAFNVRLNTNSMGAWVIEEYQNGIITEESSYNIDLGECEGLKIIEAKKFILQKIDEYFESLLNQEAEKNAN